MDPRGAPFLPGLLPALEAGARSIRRGDVAQGAEVLGRAAAIPGSRALDPGDRKILRRVLDRLTPASRGIGSPIPALGLLGSLLEPR